MTDPGTEPHVDEVREKINEILAWLRHLHAWLLHKHAREPVTWEELDAGVEPPKMPETKVMMRGVGPPDPPPDDLL